MHFQGPWLLPPVAPPCSKWQTKKSSTLPLHFVCIISHFQFPPPHPRFLTCVLMHNHAKCSDVPAPCLSCWGGHDRQLWATFFPPPHGAPFLWPFISFHAVLNGTHQLIRIVMIFFEHRICFQAVGAWAAPQSHNDVTSTTPVPTSSPQNMELNALPSSCRFASACRSARSPVTWQWYVYYHSTTKSGAWCVTNYTSICKFCEQWQWPNISPLSLSLGIPQLLVKTVLHFRCKE